MTKYMSRRLLLASTAVFVTVPGPRAFGRTYSGGALPWEPSETQPPMPVRPGPWLYFTTDEAAAVEAIVDRLIPTDDSGPDGKDAGCAVFIDRQFAGPFGDSRRLYMRPPFAKPDRGWLTSCAIESDSCPMVAARFA
jgi:gluconate 2-dehydrogenase gamma chain